MLRLASVALVRCSAPYGGGLFLRRKLNVTDGPTALTAAETDSIQVQAVAFYDNVASAAGGECDVADCVHAQVAAVRC